MVEPYQKSPVRTFIRGTDAYCLRIPSLYQGIYNPDEALDSGELASLAPVVKQHIDPHSGKPPDVKLTVVEDDSEPGPYQGLIAPDIARLEELEVEKTWDSGEWIPLRFLAKPPADVGEKTANDLWFFTWLFFQKPTTAKQFEKRYGSVGDHGLKGNLAKVLSAPSDPLPYVGHCISSTAKKMQRPNVSNPEYPLALPNENYVPFKYTWHLGEQNKRATFVSFAQILYFHTEKTTEQLRSRFSNTDRAFVDGMKKLIKMSDVRVGTVVREFTFEDEGRIDHSFEPKHDPENVLSQKRNTYVNSLKRHFAFTHALETDDEYFPKGSSELVEPLAHRKHKIALWDAIAKVLADMDSSSRRYETLERIGINEDIYSDDYRALISPELGNADLTELLGFAGDTLGWKYMMMGTPMWRKLTPSEEHFTEQPDFVEFGRKLLAFRSDMEHSANDLVAFLKGQATATGPPKFKSNAFLQALKHKPYEEQLSTLADALEELPRTEAGRRYLGEMFRYRDHPGMFDPVNLFNPAKVDAAAKNKQKKPTWTADGPIICIDKNRYGTFFDEDGTLKLYGNETKQSKALAKTQARLAKPLAVGLAEYVKLSEDHWEDVTKPEAKIVARAYYFTYLNSLLQSDGLTWAGIKPWSDFEDWATTREILPGGTQSTSLDTVAEKMAKNYQRISSTAATVVNEAPWRNIRSPRSLKVVNYGMINHVLVLAELADTTFLDQSNLSAIDVTGLTISWMQAGLDTIDFIADHWSGDLVKPLRGVLGELLSKIGTVMDLVTVSISFVNEINYGASTGDIDAAVLGGAAALVDAGLAVISLTALSGGALALAVSVGVGLSMTLEYLQAMYKDPEIAILLSKTVFGDKSFAGYDNTTEAITDTADYDTYGNIEKEEFRFVLEGETEDGTTRRQQNFSRQVSAVSSVSGGFEVTEANLSFFSASNEPGLAVTVDLGGWHGDTGDLLLRPWFEWENGKGETRTVSPGVAHRIELDDQAQARDPDSDDWGTRCPYLPADVRGHKTDFSSSTKKAKRPIAEYYDAIGAKLPGGNATTKPLKMDLPYMHPQRVESRLQKDLKNAYGSLVTVPASELERLSSVGFATSDDTLSVQLKSTFTPALLGCFLPRITSNTPERELFGEANAYLEVIHVANGPESNVSEVFPSNAPVTNEDVRSLLGMGVAYDIVPVEPADPGKTGRLITRSKFQNG